MMSRLPQTKTENIVVQYVGDEVLIYDLITNKAFCLNETSALVYNACDGKTVLADFKRKHNFPDELIFFALDELSKQDLIEKNYESPLKGMKRREVIKKIGLATMVALPVIASLVAPTALQAASICGGTNAPGFVIGCIQTAMGCEVMGSPLCTSCSATGTITIGAGACTVASPFLCVCD